MALVINTNNAANIGARNLSKTQDAQAQVFNRLSTGLRINSAKDDAGGLFLAEAQTKDIKGLAVATRNAGDGISLAQTAEGALDQINTNLQRINELALQSSNGTYSTAARNGLQKEVDALTQEIKRVSETTEFNGKKLLNSDAKSVELQVGFRNSAGSQLDAGIKSGGLAKIGTGNALSAIIKGTLTTKNAVSVTTQTAAQCSIELTRKAIDSISEMRATFGAVMNRFESVISGNQTYSQNLTAARSRIQDADFAAETANLAKQQVLQQAGVSALGQANSAPQVALGLL